MDELIYDVVAGPMGDMLVASTAAGVCLFEFLDSGSDAADCLRRRFPRARFRRGTDTLHRHAIAAAFEGGECPPLDLSRASDFERRVWGALMQIPRGSVVSYGDIARAIGRPQATRAVGRAVGANPLAVLIPCHRVVHADGSLGGYRWGVSRKRQLLESEYTGENSSLFSEG